MAAPFPANMDICDPKCKCFSGPYANQAYSCDDPCGTGNKEDFNPLDCSCPDIYYPAPAIYINAIMVRCYTTRVYDGWITYLPSTLAQNYIPTTVELAPYTTGSCSVAEGTVSALGIKATWEDGSTRNFLGGVSYIADKNQYAELYTWSFGDANADYYYPVTFTVTDNP